jgi:ubiquinone/menaquinone biosynthesis C-methylase UbiE
MAQAAPSRTTSDREPQDIHRYTLGSNPAERARLQRQSDELREHAGALLDRVGLHAGGRAIDIGCGPSGTLELLSERAGPTGSVTGLDFNPLHVTQAAALARERGLSNVKVVEGDARSTGLPSASFDLVHARLVLVNIPDPADVVAEMTRLVSPGGWVAGEEPDVSIQLCYPPHPAWDQLGEIFRATYLHDGADPRLGRRLPELFRQAGLVDVGVEARADIYPAGHPRRTIRLDLVQSMRAKILELELISERELDELDRAVRKHVADPDTVVMPCLYVMAWGRKPGKAADPCSAASGTRTDTFG